MDQVGGSGYRRGHQLYIRNYTNNQDSAQSTIFDLPIEIFTLIVTDDFKTFRAAIRAPGIAQLTVHEYCQNIAKSKFIQISYNKFNDKFWLVNGIRHRIDDPAVEFACGSRGWYINGKLHRTNGPAIESINGDKAWFCYGELHREDGPALEYASGKKEWHFHDNLHRTNGPAIEYSNGDKYWYCNGILHREDGPAIEYISGDKYWYKYGKRVYEETI